MVSAIAGPCERIIGFKFTGNDRHISYLPLAHIFERFVIYIMALNGTKIGFYSGNVL